MALGFEHVPENNVYVKLDGQEIAGSQTVDCNVTAVTQSIYRPTTGQNA